MRRPLVAANWKMHGTLEGARTLAAAVAAGLGAGAGAEVVLCPPFVHLEAVARSLGGTPLGLGAQDVSEHAEGAYTGEVAASMLTDLGCRYVIVGHSERRSLHGESDRRVAAKFGAARTQGLTPILCLGERLEERDAGDTEAVVARQLDAVLEACGVQGLRGVVLAYEPVWAIGTGRTAAPEQAQAVHGFLRAHLAARDAGLAAGLRILYGGSVKSANAAALFGMPDIDGGLIGGASLQAREFLAICEAAGRE